MLSIVRSVCGARFKDGEPGLRKPPPVIRCDGPCENHSIPLQLSRINTVSGSSIDANPIVMHHYFWDTIMIEIVHEQLLPLHRALRFESGLRHGQRTTGEHALD